MGEPNCVDCMTKAWFAILPAEGVGRYVCEDTGCIGRTVALLMNQPNAMPIAVRTVDDVEQEYRESFQQLYGMTVEQAMAQSA